MPTAELRYTAFPLHLNPGQTRVLHCDYGTSLAGRTFAAVLDDIDLDVSIDGTVVDIVFDGALTEDLSTREHHTWFLYDITSSAVPPLQVEFGGPAFLSTRGTELPDATVAVTSRDIAVNVTVLGEPGPPGAAGAGATAEEIMDVVGAAITAGARISVTYDDPAGTVTIAVTGLTSTDLSDFAEAMRDRLGATLVAGAGISIAVDDPGDTVTITAEVTQAELDTEAAARASADTTLQSNITAEAAARAAADTAEASTRAAADSAEATARANADALLISLTQKGAANGVATLDSSTLIPDGQIPSTIARDSETTNAIAAEAAARDAAIAAAIAALVASAPGVLDTLEEIADALGDDANFAATMTTALATKQPVDAELTAWATLTSAANKLGYFTGSGAAAVTDFTAFARTLLDDPDGPTMRATLGLVIGTNVQAWNANLDTLAAGGAGATAYLVSLLSATYALVAPLWVTGRAYVVGELVISSGTLYEVTTAHTSGGAFDATKFTAIGGGGDVVGIDVFEGLPLFGYGHSFMAGNAGSHSANAKYMDRINRRHGFGSLSNRGVSAQEAAQTMVDVIGNGFGATAWASGTKGVVVLDMMINNVRLYGSDADGIAAFKDSLTAAIRILRSSVRRAENHASLTYTGSWADSADGNLLDSAAKYTGTAGAKVDIAVSDSTEYTILSDRLKQGLAAGTIQVAVDGGAPVEASCGGGLPASSPTLLWHVFGVTVSGLSTAAHTITVTKKAGDANNVYVDGWCDLSTTPPLVVVLKDPVLNSWTGIGSPYNNGSDAAQALYATAVDQVVALFPSTEVIAATPTGWDKTTMISSDTIHPNDKGMAAIASGLDVALATITAWRNGLHVL